MDLLRLTNPGEPPPPEAFEAILEMAPETVALAQLINIVSLVAWILLFLALTAQSVAALHQQELTLLEGIRTGMKRFWPFLGMSIMFFLAFVGVYILFFCAIFGVSFSFAGVMDATGGPDGLAIVGIVCGVLIILLLFFGSMLYLSARWVAAPIGLLTERWGPIEAMRESWRLTKGSAARILGYLVLLSIFYLVIMIIQFAVLQSTILFTFFFVPRVAAGLSGALSSIVSALVQPFMIAAIVLLYYDLRVRQQGYDLDLRIRGLEEEMPPTGPTTF
ncbi:glycerophosphoryl diester phosphodiesterase membrane domain-containing protein [Chloroflexi bacterium TSY]|nr:glycerophosphoryl diester phosphodiesterase membrane domain-containing protein [Chloroflexi bacterium TSY]